ncbi:MAG: DUF4349 domain-containing protein, partial [Frankiaceae bacterium]|nr:DUF4349 domain-containing protein [Frankiaceae bacterium]
MTDTELLIRDTLSSYAEEAELADLVAAAKAQSRQLQRAERARPGTTWLRGGWTPRRTVALVAAAAVVFVAIAIAIGGGGAPLSTKRQTVANPGVPLSDQFKSPADRLTKSRHRALATTRNAPIAAAPSVAPAAPGLPVPHPRRAAANTYRGSALLAPTQSTQDTVTGALPNGSGGADYANTPQHDNGLGATYVVKTGEVDITVAAGDVPATMSALITKGKDLGGYVSSSTSDTVSGGVVGEVVLRVPVAKFEAAVTAAQRLGKVTYQTTDAHDVTGKVVDLGARLNTLRHSRSTYLTILSRANTIGETLSVQQRVDDIQSQIERLQGKLKVLRNQSADSTLTVAISEPDTNSGTAATPAKRTGI